MIVFCQVLVDGTFGVQVKDSKDFFCLRKGFDVPIIIKV
jgi:hypothetical protein